MNICLITPELPPFVIGGIGTYVEVLANGYASLGHGVTVAGVRIHSPGRISHAWGESISLTPIQSPLFSALFQLREKAPFIWRLQRFWRAVAFLKDVLAVRDYVRANVDKFDIVEVSNWPGHGVLIHPGLMKLVIRISTPASESGVMNGRFMSWCEGMSCQRANLVIVNSEAMRLKAQECYWIWSGRSIVIRHGLPDVLCPEARPALNRLSIIYIGRAEHRKGTDLLIEALSIVMPKHPELVFRIVGGDFDSFAEKCGRIRTMWLDLKASCGDRIEQLGRVDDALKHEIIASSHWLVVPSRFESFGLVAVEAMRLGTPVLAAKAGGLEEVCNKVPGNRLFCPSDVADLAACLDEVCAFGPVYALGLRQSAREGYLKWFRSEQMVEASLSAYKSLLGHAPTGSVQRERGVVDS